jgi:hypothetical protein
VCSGRGRSTLRPYKDLFMVNLSLRQSTRVREGQFPISSGMWIRQIASRSSAACGTEPRAQSPKPVTPLPPQQTQQHTPKSAPKSLTRHATLAAAIKGNPLDGGKNHKKQCQTLPNRATFALCRRTLSRSFDARPGVALAAHPHRNLPPTATGEKRKIDKTNPNPISGTNPPNHQGTRDLGTMS